jgi:hypothetical protein
MDDSLKALKPSLNEKEKPPWQPEGKLVLDDLLVLCRLPQGNLSTWASTSLQQCKSFNNRTRMMSS